MGSVTTEQVFFWCHACSRLNGTRAGEAVAACPVCLAPSASSLERIVDVVDGRTLLAGCDPAGPPARASAEPLPVVTVRDAGLTCPICLDELEPGASAAETPCQHLYHPACVAPWLEAKGTCPLCREKSGNAADAGAASTPDGLILGDLRTAGFCLGRRTAGRVSMVGVLEQDGGLVRHCTPLPYRARRPRLRLGLRLGLRLFRTAYRRLQLSA